MQHGFPRNFQRSDLFTINSTTVAIAGLLVHRANPYVRFPCHYRPPPRCGPKVNVGRERKSPLRQANHTSATESTSHSLDSNRTHLGNRLRPLEDGRSYACPALYFETEGELASQYLQGKAAATPPGPLTPTRGPTTWGKTMPSLGTKTRLVLGVHWFSDVAFGLLFGVA